MLEVIAASATIFYTLVSGYTHQACYQKVGDAQPTCKPYSGNLAVNDLADDADYDFWMIVGSQASPKTRIHTEKKTLAPLAPPSVVSSS